MTSLDIRKPCYRTLDGRRLYFKYSNGPNDERLWFADRGGDLFGCQRDGRFLAGDRINISNEKPGKLCSST